MGVGGLCLLRVHVGIARRLYEAAAVHCAGWQCRCAGDAAKLLTPRHDKPLTSSLYAVSIKTQALAIVLDPLRFVLGYKLLACRGDGMQASIADHAVIKIDAVVELIECGRLGVAHGVDCSIGRCYKSAGLWGRHDRRKGLFCLKKAW